MSSPLEREALVDVIERCAWLTEYYDRTGVAPQSVDVLKSTMYRAMIDLQALSPSMYTDSLQLSQCDRDRQDRSLGPAESAINLELRQKPQF